MLRFLRAGDTALRCPGLRSKRTDHTTLKRAMAEAEWSDFKIVLALGRGGSIAGAARLLRVDNSTVSRRLAAVEAALGASLIVRGGGEFVFTEEGKAALAAAEVMDASVLAAASSIRAFKHELDGVVRISCISSMIRVLMPFQALVAEKHPELSVELDSAQRFVDLAKGEADIAIRMVSKPTELDLVPTHPFDWAEAVFASKAYLAQHGCPQGPEELKNHSLVQYAESLLDLPPKGWIEKYARKDRPSLRVESTEMAFSVIAQGAGIGVIACFYGDVSPELVRVFPEPVFSTTGWIVYHETKHGSARVRTVVDLLGAYLDARKTSLSGRPLKK
jgi:DNA-binding transcriptional LysR family regulator